MSKAQRALADFFGLRKDIIVLLMMVILVGLGEKMAERFLPLYLVALGGSTFAVGLLNGLDNLLSALYSFPGGYASDRLGYKRALALFNGIAILGYLIVIVFPYWQAVLVGAIFFISWTAISLPATMDMVSSVLPMNKRTMGVSLHSLVRRIPMALGPIIGGWLIGLKGEKDGTRLAFVAALVLALVSLVLQQRLIDDKRPANKRAEGNPLRSLHLLSPDLRRLLVSDILVRFCEQIPYAFVVLWVVKENGLSALQFGVLTTIEMVVAMLIYVPIAYLADKNTKKPFVVITFGFFTLFPLVLLWAHSFWMFVIAFVVRGLKEFGEPTRKALIMDLAPEGHKATTFGVYYLLRDIVVSVAAFGGALLWDATSVTWLFERLGWAGSDMMRWMQSVASPALNLVVASVLGLLGTLYFAIWGRDLRS